MTGGATKVSFALLVGHALLLLATLVAAQQDVNITSTTQIVVANNTAGVPEEFTLPKPFIVCTIPLLPMSDCTLASNASVGFTGLSIQVFREISKDAFGWVEGDNYQFACVDTDTPTTLYERVVPEGGDCDAFIASTTITAERQANGVVFAHAYYQGSIGVITKSTPQSSKGWAWTRPFTWQLWLALGVTALVLPLIVYFLEVMSIKRRISTKETMRGYNESAWRTVWVMIQGETMGVTTIAARSVVIMLCFASLILSSSYTANLAAFLTIKSYGEINDINDLVGLSVSTVEVYQERFRDGYGLRTVIANISSYEDIREEMRDVEAGRLAAFLIDREVAQYEVAMWPDCRLRLLPAITEPFGYGLAFGRGTPRPVVDAFTLSIYENTEDRTIEGWANDFLLSDSPCLESSLDNNDMAQLSFAEVYGLWVLIAAGIFLGIVIMCAKRYHKYRRNPEWGRRVESQQADVNMDEWSKRVPSMSPAGSADLARKFERGDSRETKHSDLYRIESHITESGAYGP